MKNLITLIKLSWRVKSNIRHCLSFDKNSDEYQRAHYYETLLNNIDDEKITIEEIDKLKESVHQQQLEHQESKALNELFMAINDFLEQIQHMKMSN